MPRTRRDVLLDRLLAFGRQRRRTAVRTKAAVSGLPDPGSRVIPWIKFALRFPRASRSRRDLGEQNHHYERRYKTHQDGHQIDETISHFGIPHLTFSPADPY